MVRSREVRWYALLSWCAISAGLNAAGPFGTPDEDSPFGSSSGPSPFSSSSSSGSSQNSSNSSGSSPFGSSAGSPFGASGTSTTPSSSTAANSATYVANNNPFAITAPPGQQEPPVPVPGPKPQPPVSRPAPTPAAQPSSLVRPPVVRSLNFSHQEMFQRPMGVPNAASGGKPVQTFQNKYELPPAVAYAGKMSGVSWLRGQGFAINQMSGSALFPPLHTVGSQTGLVERFDDFVGALKELPHFASYFKAIKLSALHDLYEYLLQIFTTLNMSHVNSTRDYLAQKNTQAINHKRFLINHLMDIIQSQLNGPLVHMLNQRPSHFPQNLQQSTVPHEVSTHVGMILVKNDNGVNLNFMLKNNLDTAGQVQEIMRQETRDALNGIKIQYLVVLGAYLAFAQEFTSFLQQKQVGLEELGLNMFAAIAAEVGQALQSVESGQFNPPLFFFDQPTLTGVRVIPMAAWTLPTTWESVAWPAQVVADAKSGAQPVSMGTPLPWRIAFFKDAAGNVTQTEPATPWDLQGEEGLFMNIPMKNNIYIQPLLPQPMWLNLPQGQGTRGTSSYRPGVMDLVRACLGDLEAAVGLGIYNPCLEQLLQTAPIIMQELSASGMTATQFVKQFAEPAMQATHQTLLAKLNAIKDEDISACQHYLGQPAEAITASLTAQQKGAAQPGASQVAA